jgi:uncharacterized protein (DUF433 family)
MIPFLIFKVYYSVMTRAASHDVISVFSEDHVERLTGVSKPQLRYWDRTDFFKPAFASEDRRAAYSRVYSFKDVASLRVLNVLRNQYSVPLQHLRKVARELSHLSDAKWTATELFVLNKRVVFAEPGTQQYREIIGGQYVLGIPLKVILSDTKRDIERLHARDEDSVGRIVRARYISHNTWVVAGTRIPVATIKRFAEDGYSIEQIVNEYPTLTAADVEAAIEHVEDGLAA